MRLVSLSWEPRAQQYIAVTDQGAFLIPNEPGGWAKRRRWEHSAIFKPVDDVQAKLVFLGAVPPPRLAGTGCKCLGRR